MARCPEVGKSSAPRVVTIEASRFRKSDVPEDRAVLHPARSESGHHGASILGEFTLLAAVLKTA